MLEIFGSLAPILQKLIGLIPNPEDRQKALDSLQNFQLAMSQQQNQINLAEAQSDNIFKSGWRPACGWLCVAGLAYSIVQAPLYLPAFDNALLLNLLFGLLGLGTLRTAENVAKIAVKK